MWEADGSAPVTPSTSGQLHPEVIVRYLRSLGVTPETTRAIKDEVEKKRAADQEQRRKRIRDASTADSDDHSGVNEFAKRQSGEIPSSANTGCDSSSVMVWGILEGHAGKVEEAYGALVDFVASSWELYRAELDGVTFPVFVHCYLTLVEAGYGEQARRLMKAWGGEHEARYRDEVKLLRMVTAKEHIGASEYAQLVLKHKFRVRMCLAASKLLNAFLVNRDLLLVMNILNTRVTLVLEDRSPLPSLQVVRCGPDDAFPVSLRRDLVEFNGDKRGLQDGGVGSEAAEGNVKVEEEIKWAAPPFMEVALLKQTERNAAASGLDYPLSVNPKVNSRNIKSQSADRAAATSARGVSTKEEASPAVAVGGAGTGTGTGGVVVPTGSEAAAKAKARLKKLEAASEVTEARAKQHGGLRQAQVTLPRKPPPQPEYSESWPYLRMALRPLDSRLLNDAFCTPEGGAKPFVANPLSPHVVMVTFFNSHQTLCCLKPTRDGVQIAAGFADRIVRVWRTAPNAPYPSTAAQTPHQASSNPSATQGGASSSSSSSGAVEKSIAPMTNEGANGNTGDTTAAVEEPMRFVAHTRPVYGLSWSPDGRFLLSGGGGGDVRLWDMARGKLGNAAGCARYDGHNGAVWDVTFCPAGYYFATASADRTACLWSTDRAQPLRIFAGHLKGVLCVAFHPNGNYVVTGSMDKTIRVWDVQTGNCVRLLAGHAGSVTCLAVSPSGRKIAAGSSDNNIRLWDIATGKPLALLKGHTDDVESLDFSAGKFKIYPSFLHKDHVRTSYLTADVALLPPASLRVSWQFHTTAISREGSALVSGGKDKMVMIWDAATACASGGVSRVGDGISASPSDHEMEEAKHESQASGGSKQKRAGRVWTSGGDGPSHGPVHAFATRNTGVYSVIFTKKNLVIAAGVCHGKT